MLGAGAGLGTLPVVDARWQVLGVRGLLTASALGLPPALAIGDPAVLVAEHVAPAAARRGVGFMPHYASMAHWDWRRTVEGLGLVFVDPCAPVEATLAQIAGLESLVSEAMHGAIVADALRTPWVGVAIDPGFYDWKWSRLGAERGGGAGHPPPARAFGRGAVPAQFRQARRAAAGRERHPAAAATLDPDEDRAGERGLALAGGAGGTADERRGCDGAVPGAAAGGGGGVRCDPH